MHLELYRSYFSDYTEGMIMVNGVILCHSIELPWKNNVQNISCIPSGTYQIQFRSSSRHKDHLMVRNVPDRSFILLHPANDSKKELRGCIAPVMQLTGNGTGSYSRVALDLILLNLRHNPADQHFLTIKRQL